MVVGGDPDSLRSDPYQLSELAFDGELLVLAPLLDLVEHSSVGQLYVVDEDIFLVRVAIPPFAFVLLIVIGHLLDSITCLACAWWAIDPSVAGVEVGSIE